MIEPNIVISSSSGDRIKHWQVRTGEVLSQSVGHTGNLNCLLLYQNKLISGSSDSKIKIWNSRNGRYLSTLNGHEGSVSSLQPLIDNKDRKSVV